MKHFMYGILLILLVMPSGLFSQETKATTAEELDADNPTTQNEKDRQLSFTILGGLEFSTGSDLDLPTNLAVKQKGFSDIVTFSPLLNYSFSVYFPFLPILDDTLTIHAVGTIRMLTSRKAYPLFYESEIIHDTSSNEIAAIQYLFGWEADIGIGVGFPFQLKNIPCELGSSIMFGLNHGVIKTHFPEESNNQNFPGFVFDFSVFYRIIPFTKNSLAFPIQLELHGKSGKSGPLHNNNLGIAIKGGVTL